MPMQKTAAAVRPARLREALCFLLLALAAAALLAVAHPAAAQAEETTVADGGTIEVTLSATVGPADTSDVAVLVVDAQGAPLEGASVALEGMGQALTDAQGTVLLKNLEVGKTFRLSVQKNGYRSYAGSITCQGVADERWRIVLEAEEGPVPPESPDDPGVPAAPPGSGAGAGPGSGLLGNFGSLLTSTGDGRALLTAAGVLAVVAASSVLAFMWARRNRAERGRHGAAGR